jgi:hypothetical protein
MRKAQELFQFIICFGILPHISIQLIIDSPRSIEDFLRSSIESERFIAFYS